MVDQGCQAGEGLLSDNPPHLGGLGGMRVMVRVIVKVRMRIRLWVRGTLLRQRREVWPE